MLPVLVLYLYSSTQAQVPFGDGFLCVGHGGAGQHRLSPALLSNADGFFVRLVDFTSPPASSGSGAIHAGQTWYHQLWYRDSGGPGGTGFNGSDAATVILSL